MIHKSKILAGLAAALLLGMQVSAFAAENDLDDLDASAAVWQEAQAIDAKTQRLVEEFHQLEQEMEAFKAANPSAGIEGLGPRAAEEFRELTARSSDLHQRFAEHEIERQEFMERTGLGAAD